MTRYILFHSFWLTVSVIIFLVPVRHRSHAPLRIVLSLLVISLCNVVVQLCVPQLLFRLLLSYLLVTGCFFFCANLQWRAQLYCSIWVLFLYGSTIQIFAVLFMKVGVGEMLPLPGRLVASIIVFLLYSVVGCTIAKWMTDEGDYHIGPRQLVSAFLLLGIYLSTIWQFVELREEISQGAAWVIFLMVELYCATILYLQHELFRKSAIRQELAVLNHIWMQQKNQYSLARENIAMINQKCHDLKHQIQGMRLMGSHEERERCVQEMEQSIQIYDSIAKTGNEVLDTVLTEKSLYCEANGIQVHCVANGTLLTFLDPVDLYTMFGNALDNAIESVKEIEISEQRLIDVLIYEEQKFVIVQIINPASHGVEFDSEGLPISSKHDKNYHGFGLRSIRHTVRKHGGILRVKVQNGCFYLQMTFPIGGGESM